MSTLSSAPPPAAPPKGSEEAALCVFDILDEQAALRVITRYSSSDPWIQDRPRAILPFSVFAVYLLGPRHLVSCPLGHPDGAVARWLVAGRCCTWDGLPPWAVGPGGPMMAPFACFSFSCRWADWWPNRGNPRRLLPGAYHMALLPRAAVWRWQRSLYGGGPQLSPADRLRHWRPGRPIGRPFAISNPAMRLFAGRLPRASGLATGGGGSPRRCSSIGPTPGHRLAPRPPTASGAVAPPSSCLARRTGGWGGMPPPSWRLPDPPAASALSCIRGFWRKASAKGHLGGRPKSPTRFWAGAA